MRFSNIFAVVLLFIGTITQPAGVAAQLHQGFNYQAVVRDSDYKPLASSQVSIRISIHQGSATGTMRWQELHLTETDNNGMVVLTIGGDPSLKTGGDAGTLEEIDWSGDLFFLHTEARVSEGAFMDLGFAQINAVPLAISVLSNEDADADPTNELQGLELSGSLLSISGDPDGTPVDLSGLSSESIWTRSGDEIYYTGGNVGVGTSSPSGTVSIKASESTGNGPLFEVLRNDGYPVFAVYEDGVYAYTDTVDTGKGIKGGFAVGGYKTHYKGVDSPFMKVTADSIRFYVDQDDAKGIKGGFAVGGYKTHYKGPAEEYLRVTPDSVRVYIDDTSQGKGLKGGFAVGGYKTHYKGGKEYFNISGKAEAEMINGENRLVWYPLKNAFLTGRVLVESADSVGENSMATGYESKAVGDYSEAFGFRSIARGAYSTAIGKNAVAGKDNSFAFGDHAQAENTDAYAFGSYARAKGKGSFALGYVEKDVDGNPVSLPTVSEGDYSLAFGKEARSSGSGSMALGSKVLTTGESATAFGVADTASGQYSIAGGFENKSTGMSSVAMGAKNEAQGSYGVAMGYRNLAANSAVSLGVLNESRASMSVTLGMQNRVINGWNGIAFGSSNYVYNQYGVTVGNSNEVNGDFGIVIGDHSDANGQYSIALGKASVASEEYAVAIGYSTEAAGRHSVGIGYNANAAGRYSMAIGAAAQATGEGSFAGGGQSAKAYGDYSTAFGFFTESTGDYSLTAGSNTETTRDYAVAMGYSTTANADYSQCFGIWTETQSYASMAIGRYNLASGNPATPLSTNQLFVAGNGVDPGQKSNAMVLYYDGNMTIKGGLTQYSDIRLKTNVRKLESMLEIVRKLEPIKYEFRDKATSPGDDQIGLSAQQLNEFLPELVTEDAEGYLAVDYAKISVVLLQALKEQQAAIEARDRMISEMEARLSALETAVSH